MRTWQIPRTVCPLCRKVRWCTPTSTGRSQTPTSVRLHRRCTAPSPKNVIALSGMHNPALGTELPRSQALENPLPKESPRVSLPPLRSRKQRPERKEQRDEPSRSKRPNTSDQTHSTSSPATGTSTYLGIQMLPQKIGVVELMVGDCLTSAPYCKRVDRATTVAFHQHHLWSFQEVGAMPCMHSCTACVLVGFVVVFVCAHVRLLFIGVVVRPRETIPGFDTCKKPTPFCSPRRQCFSLRRWKFHVFMP